MLFLVAAVTSLLGTPALAQVDAGLVTAVSRCLEVREAAARLACFERAARAIQADGNSRNEATAIHGAERRRAEFGFSRKRVAAARTPKAPKPEQVRELSANVAAVTPLGNGYRLNLDNGSEWDVTESSLGSRPASGDRILVRTGVISGYRATIKGKPGLLRLRRVR